VATSSSIGREKELLAKIKKTQKRIEAFEMLAQGRIGGGASASATAPAAPPAKHEGGAPSVLHMPTVGGAVAPAPAPAAPPREDAASRYLKKALDSMLPDIEKDLSVLKR
jgi:hypothetical protein